MRIGIDIDGVLTDIETFMLEYGSKFCVENNLPLNIKPQFYDDVKMFDWTEEQAIEFWRKHIINYFQNTQPRFFAKEVITKLKEDGHEIYIITGRNEYGVPNEYQNKVKEITENWLRENGIPYDKIIFTEKSKLPYCIGNYIELMIDDWGEVLKEVSSKIPTICFNCYYNEEIAGRNITRAYTWYDIYNKIKKMS